MWQLIGAFVGGVLVTFIAFVLLRPPQPPSRSFGYFIDAPPTTEWLNDGRVMRLTKDFAYSDPDNKVWLAPKDSETDGASIPRAFWSIIGGPIEGKYRNASIIHDVACVEKTSPSDAVHRMFYFACKCGGAPEAQASTMYWAVSHFGPKWRLAAEVLVRPSGARTIVYKTVDVVEPTVPTEADAQRVLQYFQTHKVKMEGIPTLEIGPQN